MDEDSLASSSYRPSDRDLRTYRGNMFDDAVDPAELNQVVAAQASDVVFTAESAISRGSLAARPNSVNIVRAADEMQGIRVLPDISDSGSIVNGGSSRGTILGARDGLDEIKPGTLEDIFSEQQAWVVKQREDEAWKLIASGKQLSQIADELALSPKTVSVYRARVLEKMQLKNNAEITHSSFTLGLVE